MAMQVTITKTHVEIAIEQGRDTLASACCPIWQALAEKLGDLELSVGYSTGDNGHKGYTVWRKQQCIAKFTEEHAFFAVANWFDMMRWGSELKYAGESVPPEPQFPITGEVELL